MAILRSTTIGETNQSPRINGLLSDLAFLLLTRREHNLSLSHRPLWGNLRPVIQGNTRICDWLLSKENESAAGHPF